MEHKAANSVVTEIAALNKAVNYELLLKMNSCKNDLESSKALAEIIKILYSNFFLFRK